MTDDEARAQLIRTNADRVRAAFLRQYPQARRMVNWHDDLHPIAWYDPQGLERDIVQDRNRAGLRACAALLVMGIVAACCCGGGMSLTMWRV